MTILSCQEETCEIIGINVKLKSLDLTVICFYRPDKNIDDMDPFYRYINTIRIAHPKNKFLILGDFNMPDIDWQRKINFPSTPTIQNVFVSFLNDQNLEQLIKVPTHVKGNILDILCTDLGSLILDTEVISPGLSDHFLVTARIVGNKSEGSGRVNTERDILRNFHKADILRFRDAMEKLKQTIIYLINSNSEIDDIWFEFTNGIHQAIQNHVPSKNKKPKSVHEPSWFNQKAKQACAKQRKLYMRYKKCGDLQVFNKYKTLRKENKKLFRNLKTQYMVDMLYDPFNKGNTKPFFQYVKKLKGNNNAIHAIETENHILSQDKSIIANTLNLYFHSVFSKPSVLPSIPSLTHQSESFNVTREGVIKLLLGLKKGKAPGPDKITKEILCLDVDICADILVLIFNLSLFSGTIPTAVKSGKCNPNF